MTTLSKGEKCKINYLEIPFFHIQDWQNYKNSITDYWQYSTIGKLHSSLLKSSHCTSVLSLIHLTFLLPVLWTPSGKLLISISLFCFTGVSFLLLPLRAVPLPFHFTFSASVDLLRTSYVGASLYRLHVSDAFSGRVGFDMDRGSSFLGVCC